MNKSHTFQCGFYLLISDRRFEQSNARVRWTLAREGLTERNLYFCQRQKCKRIDRGSRVQKNRPAGHGFRRTDRRVTGSEEPTGGSRVQKESTRGSRVQKESTGGSQINKSHTFQCGFCCIMGNQLRRSIRSSSSAEKTVFWAARILSRICSGREAPMRTLFTIPSRRTQARAI